MTTVSGFIPIASTPLYHHMYVRKWTQEQKNEFASFVYDTITEIHKKTSRAVLLECFKAIDELNSREIGKLKRPLSCKKGCSSCCCIAVTCTNPEAKLALDTAKEKGLVIDKTRLKQQFIMGQDDTSFVNMDPDVKPCVFLQDNGECGIYEVRPMSCRNYFVVSDPFLCNTDLNPDGEAEVFVGYDSGLILSVYRSAIIVKYGEKNVQFMHNFLYKWTKEDGLPSDTGKVPEHEEQVAPTS